MDSVLQEAIRKFRSEPTYETFRKWYIAARRAQEVLPLDYAPTQNFSIAEDPIAAFTLYSHPLSEVYQRTQLATSNILSAESSENLRLPNNISQGVAPEFTSMMWRAALDELGISPKEGSIPRRWFWCPHSKEFVYYYRIPVDWDRWDWMEIPGQSPARWRDNPLTLAIIKVPYTLENNKLLFPFEKCECGRQTFLVQVDVDEPVEPVYLNAQLDCFDDDYTVEEEHDMPFNLFSGGYDFSLVDYPERLQQMALKQLSPPNNSIELPT